MDHAAFESALDESGILPPLGNQLEFGLPRYIARSAVDGIIAHVAIAPGPHDRQKRRFRPVRRRIGLRTIVRERPAEGPNSPGMGAGPCPPAGRRREGARRRRFPHLELPACPSQGPGALATPGMGLIVPTAWSTLDRFQIRGAEMQISDSAIGQIKFNEQGLAPAIVQDADNGEVLMMAWMNADSIRDTLRTGKTHFYSRSRQKYWMKGESSGHTQEVVSVHTDCDADTVLVKVQQNGAACHKGYRSCFYRKVDDAGEWQVTEEKFFDPDEVYGKKS
jgi:phosphoribosyl-AMP cyclohydrolase